MDKKQERRNFKEAMRKELREHKSSFLVFTVLRLLVMVTAVRQLFLQSYESAFFCALTLLLLYVPSWIQVRLSIELPPALEISVLCFIFAAEILGEVNAFYLVIPFWDTILHTLNGFLAAAVGFSMVVLLGGNPKLTFDLSPAFMALAAFCFSMTVGVLWEFFEFGCDSLLGTDMQKDTIIHALHTILLNPNHENAAVTVGNITSVAVNGRELGLGGYVDIGLIDTMKDLLVNFVGAAVFSFFGYFYVKSRGKRQAGIQKFVPSPKPEARDYLRAARRRSEGDGQEKHTKGSGDA